MSDSDDDKRQAYIMWLLAGALTRRLGGEVIISGEELYECSIRDASFEQRGGAYCIKIGAVRE